MYCRYTQPEALSVAYRVTYSYQGQPMASDEYGSTDFTFSVYFRPEELSPDIRETLGKHKISKTNAAAYFDLNIYRAPVRNVVIDKAMSTFCAGNFVDGS